MEKLTVNEAKTDYGDGKFFRTKEASFGVETLFPGKRVPTFHLKRNYNYVIILEGTVQSPTKKLEAGDMIVVKPEEHFWLENKTDKTAKYLFVDIPPTEEGDLVWVK